MMNQVTRYVARGTGQQPTTARPAFRALLIGLVIALTPVETKAQSGVLLGLDTDQGYRTLWIATDGDSAALLASGPDLLVPRADGFWRVGVVEFDEYTSSIAVAPVTRWSAVVDSMRAAYVPPGEDCLQSSGEGIVFLGPTHLGARRGYYQEGCTMGTRGGEGFAIAPLDDIRPLVGQRLDLDPERAVILDDALRAAPDSARRDLAMSRPDATAEERRRWESCEFSDSWTIRRRLGRWEVFVVASGPESPFYLQDLCPGYGFPLEMTLPDELIGHDDLSPGLYEISLVVPSVRDAVSSPRRDLVVALSGDSLYAARVEDGRIQRPALALPIKAQIVMAQWALGRHVARWTREMGTLLGRGRLARAAAETRRPYSQSVATRILSLGTDGTRRETGNTVLVGQPAVIGVDRASADSTVTVDEIWVDNRPFVAIPDTARDGIGLDYLLLPRFLPIEPGRYAVTARLGQRRAWERVPLHYEFVAIDYPDGNDATVIGQRPDVRFSIPDDATGVPIAYLPRLDFSEPVRHVAGRVELRSASGNLVPFRLAGVGTNASGSPRVYPNLDAAGPDVLIHSATMIPSSPLDFGTRYRVSLRAGIIDADTTSEGTPDPQPLADPSRSFDFETYRPRPLAEGPAFRAFDVTTRGSAAYLAVEGTDGEDRIATIFTANPTEPAVMEKQTVRVGGRLRGLSIANRETVTPRVVAGVHRPDGGAELLVVDGSDTLGVTGVVRMPSGTRIADVTAAGPNVYVATEAGAIHVIGVSGASRKQGRPPAEGTVAGTIPPPASSARFAAVAAADLALDGVPQTMLVAVGTAPLFTVADPTALKTVAARDSVRGLQHGHAVAVGSVAGRQIAVLGGSGARGGPGGVAVFDVTDPRAPSLVSIIWVEGVPRDILLQGSLALVSTDKKTTILRLEHLSQLRSVGVIDDLGGPLAWADPGTVILAASGHSDSAGIRTSALAPTTRATVRPFFIDLDVQGRPTGPVEIQYQVTDPPPIGQPFIVVMENATTVAKIALTDHSPGLHTLPLPPDATFVGRTGSIVDVTLVRPDGSETLARSVNRVELERSERGRTLRPSAPSEWDLHEPPPPPVARLDSISPLHAPRGSPVSVTLYGANLDSVWVGGWEPTDAGFDDRETRAYPVAPAPEGGIVALPESLVAKPTVLWFKDARTDTRELTFLVVDPDLPAMGTASAVRDPEVVTYFDDSPLPVGWFFEVRARTEPGGPYVLGRGSTPGFVMPGVIPGPYLGDADDLVLAALSPDRRTLSPAIPIPSTLPIESDELDARRPLGPTSVFEEQCLNFPYLIADITARPVRLDAVSVVGPRQLEVRGFGLTEGMRIVYRVRNMDRGPAIEETVEAMARLTRIEPYPYPVDPKDCGIDDPVPERRRARAAFTMEPHAAGFARIVWLAEPGVPGRRP